MLKAEVSLPEGELSWSGLFGFSSPLARWAWAGGLKFH